VLTMLSFIMAPFTPFLAEELFLKLTGGELGESVHLLDWPKAGAINTSNLEVMTMIRKYIEDGLRQRAEQGIKVRQPLASATIDVYTAEWPNDLVDIIAEELNVKHVVQGKEFTNDAQTNDRKIKIDWHITDELRREGMMREVIRNVQQARKQAGLQVDDRIELSLVTEDKDLAEAVTEHAETIAAETLANSLVHTALSGEAHETAAKVDGAGLQVQLRKA